MTRVVPDEQTLVKPTDLAPAASSQGRSRRGGTLDISPNARYVYDFPPSFNSPTERDFGETRQRFSEVSHN
jgi:hypothetical protein